MDAKLKFNEPWIEQRADPYVYRHTDGWYYFTASVPAYDGICLRRAKSLDKLPDAPEVEIWHKHEQGEMSIQDPLKDPWKELGKMKRAPEDEFSFEAFSLDGTVFENKGEYFYVWAEKVGVGKQISNLYIAKMEHPHQLKTVQVLLTTPDYDWERYGFWVNEGPAVIKHGNKLFLTYSASETGEHYCMGMLTADMDADLLDPLSWKKERYPVLQTDASRNIYGPGHNSFTTDEEGNDLMVYHLRTESKIEGNPLYNPNRHACLMKVRWDSQGCPVFSYEE